MERALGGMGPLVLGGVGLLVMYYVMQKMRRKNRVQNSVVVITGASSGLGKGEQHINALKDIFIRSWISRRQHVYGIVIIFFQSAPVFSMLLGRASFCVEGTKLVCRSLFRNLERRQMAKYRHVSQSCMHS